MRNKILAVFVFLIVSFIFSSNIYAVNMIEPYEDDILKKSSPWTKLYLEIDFDIDFGEDLNSNEAEEGQKEETQPTVMTTVTTSNYSYSSLETQKLEGIPLTDEDYELLCSVVNLEAGGEGEDLQRAVTEVIYNRYKCGIWGSTISEVIYSPNQFSVVPYLDEADPSELTKEIVKDVFINGNVKIKSSVLYFRTDYYHQWYGASPEFNIGNVYFSSTIWW